MLHHIILCLDEIEAEIGACTEEFDRVVCGQLNTHVADMRSILAGMRQHAAAAPVQPDNLLLIRGIDAAAAAQLAANGADRFAVIANWTASDIAALTGETIEAGRISRQGWIEQAAILATGALTSYARRVGAGEIACLVAAAPAVSAISTSVEPAAPVQPEIELAEVEVVPAVTDAAIVEQVEAVQADQAGADLPVIAAAPVRQLAALQSFLPPVFENTRITLPSNIVIVDFAAATTKVEEVAEAVTADIAATATSEAVTMPITALQQHKATGTWGRRVSLLASLMLLATVGVMGIQAKMVKAPTFQHISSVE